jgi:hypothetical protein
MVVDATLVDNAVHFHLSGLIPESKHTHTTGPFDGCPVESQIPFMIMATTTTGIWDNKVAGDNTGPAVGLRVSHFAHSVSVVAAFVLLENCRNTALAVTTLKSLMPTEESESGAAAPDPPTKIRQQDVFLSSSRSRTQSISNGRSMHRKRFRNARDPGSDVRHGMKFGSRTTKHAP